MSTLFKYRADIDGLRALAVLLVLFFHAKFSALSGGFIGVDIFFVISGFLITKIIFSEVQQNNFSYKSFYIRRIKRLAPALIFLLLITTVPAYLFLFSYDLEIFARNLIHAFIATSNFYLWQNTSGYFSPNTDLLPLLHTWSLAVEEQFYFIWPTLFIFLHKFCREKVLSRTIYLLFLCLFGLSIYLSNTSPDSAYFLLPSRAFELLMGALLAINYAKLPNLTKWQNDTLSVLALILILVPAFTISKQDVFPGLNAFWPCFGTVLLIYTGKNQQQLGIINKLLSLKTFVFIGLISYSLYLWHWPIFTFIQYVGLELTGATRITAIIAAFFCAYLSWKFIEQPGQRLKLTSLKMAFMRILLPGFILLTSIYAVIDINNGFPERFKNLSEFNKDLNFPSSVRKHCFDADKIGNIDQCWLGNKKDALDGVLIGDSFANHSAAFIDVLAKNAGLFLHDSASGGHPILTAKLSNNKLRYSPEYALQRFEYAKQFDHIILGVNWDNYSSPANNNYEYLLQSVSDLISNGNKVTVIISAPVIDKHHLHKLKLLKGSETVFFKPIALETPFPNYADDHIVNEMKRRFPDINYIDFKKVLCRNGKCTASLNDSIVYRNTDHLNVSGATMMAKEYLRLYGNPLLSR